MPNLLAAETSPYLHQHRDNPVAWQPWGEAALREAREQNKPILLSIGYSACHWCHVMAHESFEDDATAAVMNELYVNIKVDREERPDLDKVYQLAHQALTQRGGGWPLTVFLTPDDHMPFYAGTYFPREPRYGMPAFTQVLRQVRAWFDTRADDIRKQNGALREFLDETSNPTAVATQAMDRSPIDAALEGLQRAYDPRWGGFGQAPKFPHASDMELLLAQAAHDSDASTRGRRLDMVASTLARMAEGGIHDQLGGGFCRYSVDERWAIPHFEKMLYDNAVLLPLYARAARKFDLDRFRPMAQGIVDWLAREMRAPGGGYYAALDADSEGEEGRFYVWQRDEIRTALSADEWAVAEVHWGLDAAPNFEDHAWNLLIAVPLDQVAQQLALSLDDARVLIASARTRLFALRGGRIRPGLDDKILSAWNGLLASGVARAARYLASAPLISVAESVLEHLREHAWHDGRLYASSKHGVARFPAYLDDYAFTLAALLDVLQCRWDTRWLHWACAIADTLLLHFADRQGGGFYFTADDHEQLIARQKTYTDESMPSGNGIAIRAMSRLGHLLGEPRYLDAAAHALAAGWGAMQSMPRACASSLHALSEHLDPPPQIIVRIDAIAGPSRWEETVDRLAADDVEIYTIAADVGDLPGALAARVHRPGGVAYLCRGTQCLAPMLEPEELAKALHGQ